MRTRRAIFWLCDPPCPHPSPRKKSFKYPNLLIMIYLSNLFIWIILAPLVVPRFSLFQTNCRQFRARQIPEMADTEGRSRFIFILLYFSILLYNIFDDNWVIFIVFIEAKKKCLDLLKKPLSDDGNGGFGLGEVDETFKTVFDKFTEKADTVHCGKAMLIQLEINIQ